MLNDVKIVEKKKINFNSPVLVVGLPGVGFASKLTVDYLIKELKAERFATLYSSTFPNQVLALRKGVLKMLSMRFYKARVGKQDVIFLKGDIQPLTVEGQYEVSNQVLKYFRSLGGKTVISMAGYAVSPASKVPKIFCTSTSRKLFEKMKSFGAAPQKQIIPLVGMAGLLPGLSKLYGGSGCCILIETSGEAIDSNAVGRLIQLLEDYFGFKVNKDKMFKKAKEMLERIKTLNARIAKEQEQIALQEQEAQLQELALSGAATDKRDLGYIR